MTRAINLLHDFSVGDTLAKVNIKSELTQSYYVPIDYLCLIILVNGI